MFTVGVEGWIAVSSTSLDDLILSGDRDS